MAEAKFKTNLHATVSPPPKHWMSRSKGGWFFNYVFGPKVPRVELYIGGGDQAQAEGWFDRLIRQKPEIERRFGSTLNGDRLEHCIGKRVSVPARLELR